VLDYALKFGTPGPASVLGTPYRLDAEYAGLANGTSGSSFEIDDYGANGAYAHPGCIVVPAAFAIAETVGANGADVLRASTVGFELIIRLALASMPSMLLDRGFHQTGAHGVFAAALVTALLEGDGLETAVNGMAIAGSHAAGTTEYTKSGGEVKRAHGGFGVTGGIRAARLARHGLTGPATILEGKRGFLQAFCNNYEPRYLTEALGSAWRFAEFGAIKPYASCGLVHPHFAAYDKIRNRREFTPDDIEEVILGCDRLTIVHTGSTGPRPTSLVGAQFSAEYSMAMRIVLGKNDVAAYLNLDEMGFNNPAISAISDRTRLVFDEECGGPPPMGRVTVHLRSGEKISDTGYPLGSPLNPLSRADVEAKFIDLVAPGFGEATAREALSLVMRVETLPDVSALTRLFAGGGT
jgi:2-methylcitrate dehydratase PrpD